MENKSRKTIVALKAVSLFLRDCPSIHEILEISKIIRYNGWTKKEVMDDWLLDSFQLFIENLSWNKCIDSETADNLYEINIG